MWRSYEKTSCWTTSLLLSDSAGDPGTGAPGRGTSLEVLNFLLRGDYKTSDEEVNLERHELLLENVPQPTEHNKQWALNLKMFIFYTSSNKSCGLYFCFFH